MRNRNKSKFIPFSEVRERLLKDPATKKAYDDLGPEFALIEKILDERIKNGVTQAELAKRIGTKQSAISRFERGESNPSIQFLRKLADGLDVKLTITVSK